MKISFDGLVTAAVISEINTKVIGGKLQHVRQHNETDITLELRVPGFSYELFVSADARFARFLLTSIRRKSLPQAPAFCMTCRKHLGGYSLTSIRQHGFDRVVFLDFEATGQPKRTLILEIMGKHSNIILCDETNKILVAIKNVGKSISRARQIYSGRLYELPPGNPKMNIQEVSRELFQTIAADTLPENASEKDKTAWLIENYNGFGPFLAKELIQRAKSSCEPLSAAFEQLRNIVISQQYDPVTLYRDGRAVFVYPIPPTQAEADTVKQESSVSLALDMLYNSTVSRADYQQQRDQLMRMILRSARSTRSNLESVERSISEGEGAQRHRELGELLVASANSIQKGAQQVSLVDYYDPDQKEVVIELDSSLNAVENAERYFKKYRKLKENALTGAQRRQAMLEQLRQLDGYTIQLETAQDVETIVKIRGAMLSQNLLREQPLPTQHAKGESEFAGHKIRRVITREGWEILYGENATSNDYLTQRIARPNDVWLHARSIIGAHVVIRTAGQSKHVPPNVLMHAAQIAALNSDAKHSSVVAVDHTLRKYVRKPRNSAAGFVVYRMEKTIDIKPSRAG